MGTVSASGVSWMGMKAFMVATVVVVVGLLAGRVFASPSSIISIPPVLPPAGSPPPAFDPKAGQWFRDLASGFESVLPLEFYDNIPGDGGSLFVGSLAIEGYVTQLHYDQQGNITSFDMTATITNDTLSSGAGGGDYAGDMFGVMLTTEFADDGTLGNLPPGKGGEGNIFAKDYELMAWYGRGLNADYIVPTYSFGDIAAGESTTRVLSFGLYSPEGPGSDLAIQLETALLLDWDMFINRTTSSKISQYLEDFLHDDGAAFPSRRGQSSDTSVFFVPEPATMCLVGLGFLGLLFRGRHRHTR